ncbi:uncharacterized protein LOC141695387 [Apium graveolens]|uniref:uncharacterized protein LOC141695387 n=1 Tax=Apium graveolens TaxID=4045 RepID=UPI003D7AD47B
MGGEEGDKFFNLEDLNAYYGRKYRRTKQLNRNKENVVVDSVVADRCALSSSTAPVLTGSMANVYTPSTKTNRSPLFTPTIVSSGSQNKTPTSMLMESMPNIVRLVGKRRKLGDLPRSGHLNKTAAKCSNPIVTPRSNSRVNYMNPLEGSQDRTHLSDVTNSGSASFSRNMLREETRSNINDVSLNGREPLNRKGKENYLGFGRELFADEIVSDDEEESNDFNEGPNVVAPSFLSDDSEGSDYEASDCESSVIVDGMNSDCNLMQSRRAPRRVVPEEYASLGGSTAICSKCHARMWKEERKRGPTFHRLIRLYNAIFAFTSTDGNIDHSINNGRAPYVYRLNGQNQHIFGSLIPNDNETPKFCQLYIYDTINEVDNRLRWVSAHDRESVDKEVVRGLITILDETNQLVGEFRLHSKLSDLRVEENVIFLALMKLLALWLVTEETCGDCYIIVNEKGKGLVRVYYVHPKLMALQYPLLFPRGEDGFHSKIKFQKTADSSCKPRSFLSLKNYYSYTFQIRESNGKTRLWWIRTHQTTLRNELYSNICRSVSRGDVDSSNIGKGIFLPAGYVGSKRYMQQNFQDTLANVDNFVFAEIPDPLLDPVGYAAVKEFMIHGPCGLQNVKSLCMKDLRCIRHFLKKYCARTTFDDSGFPMYMRRRTNIIVEIRKAELDNQWRKRKRQANDTDEGGIDEINAYFDGRYLCGAESAYRIFGFPIHHRSISVERLQFHLPGDKKCTFCANEALGKVAAREKNKFSKLEAFFYLNSVDVNARKYTYDEIPQFYVWNDGERKWTMRKRGFQIGRLCYVHHSTGEPWFLPLLLTKVHGATSFESLRTVNGVCYSTFRDACKEYGLLDDDQEWHEVLTQASAGGLPPQVRQLFVHIIVNCKVTDLKTLWITHWRSMVDDILLRRHQSCPNTLFTLNDMQLQFYALGEIDELLRSVGKSLKKFDQLPQPPRSYLNNGINNLIIEDTSYDTRKMEYETAKLLQDCTEEQRKIYDAVIQSIDTNVGGIFFVYGSGGCGKTFLWRTLICKLRSQGKIVLPIASSGIAATIMPGGWTAHSRFKIPIVLDECSTCNIAHDLDVAQLIKQTKLIIWDEVPMQHRYAFECLDRSLKDIMKAVDPECYAMPFGGITVVLGGDFRQILPVITYGDRADIVAACESDSESEELKKFAKWVLDIGNGQVSPPRVCNFPVTENQILISSQFCDVQTENTVDNMICSTYPNFAHKGHSTQYLSERAILTPTNQTVGHLNSLIIDKLPGESVSYFSVDAVEEFGGTDENLNEAFPIEYLNSLNVAGMPPHDLKLKVRVVVMLMRNLNQTLGLCNGTRMIMTKCLRLCMECEVICGTFVGSKHFIPRMELSPSDTKMPFKLVRKQMPLQICYDMTINKSQGQSLKTVGLYLPKSVFTYGQYYVAISRVTSPTGLTIFVDDDWCSYKYHPECCVQRSFLRPSRSLVCFNL